MNNSIDFRAFFSQEMNNQPPIGMVMKYNIFRANHLIKHIIFVEGSSDKTFYSKTRYSELNSDAEYVYQNYEEGNGGKESVFYAYYAIKKDDSLRVDINRSVFVVDKDWDTALRSENNWVKKKDEPFFTVTKGHSMECYFIDSDNIDIIFAELGISQYSERFHKLLAGFLEQTKSFWALKSVMSYAHKKGIKVKYRKKYSFGEIFDFDFNDSSKVFNLQMLLEEVSAMEESISGNQDLLRYYEIWKKRIQEDVMLIRGHDAFSFLQSFINSVRTKKVSDRDLFDLVPVMEVKIDIRKP